MSAGQTEPTTVASTAYSARPNTFVNQPLDTSHGSSHETGVDRTHQKRLDEEEQLHAAATLSAVNRDGAYRASGVHAILNPAAPGASEVQHPPAESGYGERSGGALQAAYTVETHQPARTGATPVPKEHADTPKSTRPQEDYPSAAGSDATEHPEVPGNGASWIGAQSTPMLSHEPSTPTRFQAYGRSPLKPTIQTAFPPVSQPIAAPQSAGGDAPKGNAVHGSAFSSSPSESHYFESLARPSSGVAGIPTSNSERKPTSAGTTSSGSISAQPGGGYSLGRPERSSTLTSPTGHQGPYQYMTLETDQGPLSFPVDVQAASRVADEKRRRNAGASARFRARRKEKEQANNREIEDLKRQIHELGEDAEFYRRERDYLASILFQGPDRERYFPRPASPRRYRPTLTPMDGNSGIAGQEGLGLYEEQGSRGTEGRHTRRRLTGDFPTEAQQASTMAPAHSMYGSSPYSGRHSFSHPAHQVQQHAQPQMQGPVHMPQQTPPQLQQPAQHPPSSQALPPPVSQEQYGAVGFNRSWPPHSGR